MKLYLVRHATAADVAPSDAERPLTGDGCEEARILGRALRFLDAQPAQIISSPLRRARQTAEIIAAELKFQDEVAVFDELNNGRPTAMLVRALKQFTGVREFLLVGHMPSLAGHLAQLIHAGDTAGLSFGKANVACVENGELRWFLRQKQLRLIARK